MGFFSDPFIVAIPAGNATISLVSARLTRPQLFMLYDTSSKLPNRRLCGLTHISINAVIEITFI